MLSKPPRNTALPPEARLAWEIVEEMDASDNSAAFTGGVNEEECDVEATSAECIEYGEKLAELQTLIADSKPVFDQVKTAAADIRAVKVSDAAPAVGRDSPQLRAAIKEAKAATKDFGVSSKEAVLAWETVEEIASADQAPALGGKIDDDCLVEAIEACEAIQELERVLDAKDFEE